MAPPCHGGKDIASRRISRKEVSMKKALVGCGIVAFIIITIVIVIFISIPKVSRPEPSGAVAAAATPLLEVQNWSYSRSYDYMIAQGEVKNISDKPLRNVQACISWYTLNEQFIISDHAITEYDPIMPGQVSPFKIMTRYNPEMDKAVLTFRYLLGPQINTREKLIN
jgi:hypothetical protein